MTKNGKKSTKNNRSNQSSNNKRPAKEAKENRVLPRISAAGDVAYKTGKLVINTGKDVAETSVAAGSLLASKITRKKVKKTSRRHSVVKPEIIPVEEVAEELTESIEQSADAESELENEPDFEVASAVDVHEDIESKAFNAAIEVVLGELSKEKAKSDEEEDADAELAYEPSFADDIVNAYLDTPDETGVSEEVEEIEAVEAEEAEVVEEAEMVEEESAETEAEELAELEEIEAAEEEAVEAEEAEVVEEAEMVEEESAEAEETEAAEEAVEAAEVEATEATEEEPAGTEEVAEIEAEELAELEETEAAEVAEEEAVEAEEAEVVEEAEMVEEESAEAKETEAAEEAVEAAEAEATEATEEEPAETEEVEAVEETSGAEETEAVDKDVAEAEEIEAAEEEVVEAEEAEIVEEAEMVEEEAAETEAEELAELEETEAAEEAVEADEIEATEATEEEPAEDEEAEEETAEAAEDKKGRFGFKKKKGDSKIKDKKSWIVSGLLIGFIAIVIIFDCSLSGVKKFDKNAYVNGVPVGGMTLEEVSAAMTENLNEVTIKSDIAKEKTIKTSFVYDNSSSAETMMKFSHVDIRKLFSDKVNYRMSLRTVGGFEETAAELEKAYPLGEGEKATTDAYIDYDNMKIVDAVQGVSLDCIKMSDSLATARRDHPTKSTFEFKREDYIKHYSIDAEDLKDEFEFAKKYLSNGLDIEDPNGKTVHIGAKQLSTVILYSKNGKPEYSLDGASAIATEIGNNTDIDVITVDTVEGQKELYNYALDSTVDVKRSAESIVEAAKNGGKGKIYTDAKELSNKIGRHVEVSISSQTVYLVEGGKVTLSTPVVTGNYGHDTPTGVYRLAYKTSPATLKGNNDDGSKYESKVTYWMPFNGGIGLHDASWRGAFGGGIYRGNGSHGCVNMPTWAARDVYYSISAGDVIMVYY